MVIVFGLAFELPLLLVMLNFGRVITGKRMLGWWRAMVIGITVFAAVATPSTATRSPCSRWPAPIVVLYFGATAICLFNDRRRRRADPDAADPATTRHRISTSRPRRSATSSRYRPRRALPEASGDHDDTDRPG